MLSDPIADMLTRIRNGYLAKKEKTNIPFSKIKEEILKILVKEGCLASYKVMGKQKKNIEVGLLYKNSQPAITHISRVSKPGRRVYKSLKNLPVVLSGYGLAIVSTSQGLMTEKEAKKKTIGGEIICKIW